MEQEQEKKQRGGARPGAGRKRTVAKSMTIGFTVEVAALMEQHSDKYTSVQQLVNDAVKAYLTR